MENTRLGVVQHEIAGDLVGLRERRLAANPGIAAVSLHQRGALRIAVEVVLAIGLAVGEGRARTVIVPPGMNPQLGRELLRRRGVERGGQVPGLAGAQFLIGVVAQPVMAVGAVGTAGNTVQQPFAQRAFHLHSEAGCAVAPRFRRYLALEFFRRSLGDEIDRSGERGPAEVGALRPLHDLNALRVLKPAEDTAHHRRAVHENHRRLHMIVLAFDAHAAYDQQAIGSVPASHRMLGEEESGREIHQVAEIGNSLCVNIRRGYRGDAHRHLKQALLAFAGGDHHLLNRFVLRLRGIGNAEPGRESDRKGRKKNYCASHWLLPRDHRESSSARTRTPPPAIGGRRSGVTIAYEADRSEVTDEPVGTQHPSQPDDDGRTVSGAELRGSHHLRVLTRPGRHRGLAQR